VCYHFIREIELIYKGLDCECSVHDGERRSTLLSLLRPFDQLLQCGEITILKPKGGLKGGLEGGLEWTFRGFIRELRKSLERCSERGWEGA